MFPECCAKSDFKRLYGSIKESIKDCFCPQAKPNIVAPSVSKGVDLFQTVNFDDDAAEDALVGVNYLRMYVTMQKTKREFKLLLDQKDQLGGGVGGRRDSDASLDTIDGHIIRTSSDENDESTWSCLKFDDKFRSASRSPTPPPDVVVIYPDDEGDERPSPNPATAAEFRLIRPLQDDTEGGGSSVVRTTTTALTSKEQNKHIVDVEIAIPPTQPPPPPPNPPEVLKPTPKRPVEIQPLEINNDSPRNEQDTARRKSPPSRNVYTISCPSTPMTSQMSTPQGSPTKLLRGTRKGANQRRESSHHSLPSSEVSPRALTSGQSGNNKRPTNTRPMLQSTNTRGSTCIITIELPERTEPDGMEAPDVPLPDSIDNSSYLTATSTDYRGESDGGEDLGEMTAEDSFYIQPLRLVDLYNKPPADNSLRPDSVDRPGGGVVDLDVHSASGKPMNKHIRERKGSYGCESFEDFETGVGNLHIQVPTVSAGSAGQQLHSGGGAGQPRCTCGVNESCGYNCRQMDYTTDVIDDVASEYTISCPSTPMTSQMSTPQGSPTKVLRGTRKGANHYLLHDVYNNNHRGSSTSSSIQLHRSDPALPNVFESPDAADVSSKLLPLHQDGSGPSDSVAASDAATSKDDALRTSNDDKTQKNGKTPRRNSLHTGVYSSPINRRLTPPRPRTYVTAPKLTKSNSNASLSKSSGSSSTRKESVSSSSSHKESDGSSSPEKDVRPKQRQPPSSSNTARPSPLRPANPQPPRSPASYKDNVSHATDLYAKKKASKKIKSKLVKR